MSDSESLFREWITETSKRSAVLPLWQAYENASLFLRETYLVRGDLFSLPTDVAVRNLSSLSANRMFKFRYRESVPWMDKLVRVFTAFMAEHPDNPEYVAPSRTVIELEPRHDRQETKEIPGSPAHGMLSLDDDSDPAEQAAEAPAEKAVRNVIDNCVIQLDGMTISKEAISQSVLSFFSEVSIKDSHNVGILLHTGSLIFDALAVLWAAIASLLANATDPEEIVRSLQPGDLVIFKGREKACFEGIETADGNERAVLVFNKAKKERSRVLKNQWSQIMPYQGSSKEIGRRSSKRLDEPRIHFYKYVLGYHESEIPSVTDTSAVFVMPREKADRIVKSLTLTYGNRTISLLDLVTASYYTDANEYQYGGNPGRNEPVIKIASRISTARMLVLNRSGNRTAGMFVCDDEVLGRSITELPELIERRTLPYVFVCAAIDNETVRSLISTYEDASLLVFTRDFLLSCPLRLQCVNEYTKNLSIQMDTILDHEVRYEEVIGFADWHMASKLRSNMFFLKDSEYRSEEKDNFVISAWSLFNLFQTAIFPISVLEDQIKLGNIPSSLGLPSERIQQLRETVLLLPEYLRERADSIVDVLDNYYHYLTNTITQGKYKTLTRLLAQYQSKDICIIVPKAYYERALMADRTIRYLIPCVNLTVITANRFDRTKHYDVIIAAGLFRGSHFDCFRCMSAPTVISLLYESEKYSWYAQRKEAVRFIDTCNRRSFIEVQSDDLLNDEMLPDSATEDDILEETKTEIAIDEYISNLQTRLPSLALAGSGSSSTAQSVEIAAIVCFDTGERAFLTPYYEACVYNESKETVREVHVHDEDISEGDFIVFTRNDSEMHDIVDDVLKRLIEAEKLAPEEKEHYTRSKVWKKKLMMYSVLAKLKPRDIAEMMTKGGAPIQEQTIRYWIDPEDHTVGPKKIESIREIGRIVHDEQMIHHPEIIMESCKRIRQRRGKILSVIGDIIKNRLSGRTTVPTDPQVREIFDRIQSQADVLRVESFSRTSREVPATFVNRPVSI